MNRVPFISIPPARHPLENGRLSELTNRCGKDVVSPRETHLSKAAFRVARTGVSAPYWKELGRALWAAIKPMPLGATELKVK